MPDTLITDQSVSGLDDAITGKTSVASWIRDAARKHGVTYAESPIDHFAAAVSRLSDAGVHLNPIEELLLTLARANVISDTQRFALHATYLRQSRT